MFRMQLIYTIFIIKFVLTSIPPQMRQLKEGEIEFIREQPKTVNL